MFKPPLRPLICALALVASCGDTAVPLATAPSGAAHVATEATNLRELVGCTDGGGAPWLAMVSVPEEDPTADGAVVLVRPGSGEVELARGPAVGPVALSAFNADAVFAVWEAAAPTGRALFGRSARWDGAEITLGDVEALPVPPGANLAPTLAAHGGGALVAAWQALAPKAPHYTIESALRAADGTWTRGPQLSTPDLAGDAWRPVVRTPMKALERSAPGPFWVAYDRFIPGSPNGFDVLFARVAEDATEIQRSVLAGGPSDALYPDLAVADDGRAWIAFEETPAFGLASALRDERQLRLLVVEPDGAVQEAVLGDELAALQRADFPRLALTPDGVAVARRVPKLVYTPRSKARQPFFAAWHTHIVRFRDGAVVDVELTEAGGDNPNETALVPVEGGLAVFVLDDLRERTFAQRYAFDSHLENPAVLRHMRLEGDLGMPALEPPAMTVMGGIPRGLPLAERSPHFVFGDLHRHTHFSRCAGRKDGTFEDAVRYARGPGALDFMSVTDHFQHLSPGSLWQQLRDLDRYHAPGSLVLLPGLERMVIDDSHQNLIWQTPAEVETGRAKTDVARLEAGSVVSIPHMSANAANPFPWRLLDPSIHRLIEVHQGLRGSYEGLPGGRAAEAGSSWPRAALDASARVGWLTELPTTFPADGDPPGLISASDHNSSAHAFAGVPVPPGLTRPLDRAQLFAALVRGDTCASTGPAPAPHAATLAVDYGSLFVRAPDATQPYELTVFEDGHVWQQTAPEAGRAHLQVGAFLGPDGDGDLEVELRTPDGTWEAVERFPFKRGSSLPERVTFDSWPAADTALRLTLKFPDAPDLTHTTTWARARAGERIRMTAARERPTLDLYGFIDGGEAQASQSFELVGRPPGALYHARLVFADGEVVWTRMVRGIR